MEWKRFKINTERLWEDPEICLDTYGYQIQAGTKWNPGLKYQEIQSFEQKLGFRLPWNYKDMLRHINGFDRESINIQGKNSDFEPINISKPTEYATYRRNCYKYPDDLDNVGWLIEEISLNTESVKIALNHTSFNFDDILGYIPLYGHRALVSFKNNKLSPIISVWGSDIVLYAKDINKYYNREFLWK